MKILAFAASSSKKSINKQLVRYAAEQFERLAENAGIRVETEILDINDYELPLFSEDRETELGQPALAQAFLDKIADSDAVIIAFAEHNGSYTAAYKNIFDWASRINKKVFQNKPMTMLATTPGPGGAANVLATAVNSAAFFDGDVSGSLSLPGFYDNFDIEQRSISNDEINAQLLSVLSSLLEKHNE